MLSLSRCAATCIALGGGTIRTAELPPVVYVSVRQSARSNGE